MKINFLPAQLLILCPGGGIGRRKGLKIPRTLMSVPVRPRLPAPNTELINAA